MKMMAIGAAAMAAALMSSSPAAAQSATTTVAQKADPDAMCLLIVAEVLRRSDKFPEADREKMQSAILSVRMAMHYFVGVLQTRYTDAQRAPVMKTAYAEFSTFDGDAISDRMLVCLEIDRKAGVTVAAALGG